ncbi:MAG: HEAT repeat domain-containing protein [Deltaproteobacteria bacterium]|nr:HEAT repeat domain-containing protein [Deltaproteobacteria bacterium]
MPIRAIERIALLLSIVWLVACESEPPKPQTMQPFEQADQVTARRQQVQRIIAQMLNGSGDSRDKAVNSLLELNDVVFKAEKQAILAGLEEVINEQQPETLAGILRVLERMQADGLELVQRVLIGPDPVLRKYAAETLVKMGKDGLYVLVASIRMVDPADKEVRRIAISSIASKLKLDDTRQRMEAVSMLGRVGHSAQASLVGALDDPDSFVRQKIISVLASRGSANEEVIQAVEKRFNENDPMIRREVLRFMSTVGQPARVLPVIMNAFSDKHISVRLQVVELLEKYLPDHRAVKVLVRAISDSQSDVGVAAIGVLQGMGTRAGPELKFLEKACSSEHPRVREAAIVSFTKVEDDPDRLAAALMRQLSNKDPALRVLAARLLGKMGAKANKAQTLLSKMADDEDGRVRQVAGRALNLVAPRRA